MMTTLASRRQKKMKSPATGWRIQYCKAGNKDGTKHALHMQDSEQIVV